MYYGLESTYVMDIFEKFKGISAIQAWKNETVVTEEDWAIVTSKVAMEKSWRAGSIAV